MTRSIYNRLLIQCCSCVLLLLPVHSGSFLIVKFKLSGRECISRETRTGDMPDLYAKVTFGTVSRETLTINNNQFPQWTEVFEIYYEPRTNTQVKVEVKENDTSTEDDVLGTVNVFPWEIGPDVERRLEHHNMYQGKIRFTKIR